jgi:hypothetical protein
MSSSPTTQDRVLSAWGASARTWSGEAAQQRVAGFDLDRSGHQRVLGFPADPPTPITGARLRVLARAVRNLRPRGPKP